MIKVASHTANLTGSLTPIVKQILEDEELVEMMKEMLVKEGKPCPFCHRKLKDEVKAREIW